MPYWGECYELMIRFKAICDLMVTSSASNLLPCCVFMLLLLSVMFKKIIKIKIINWQMVYSSVSSAEQMAQVSHRVEVKNRSILPLAQGHTKDDDQQDQNYLPKQIRSASE